MVSPEWHEVNGCLGWFMPQRGFRTQPRVSTLGPVPRKERALKGRQNRACKKHTGNNTHLERNLVYRLAYNGDVAAGQVRAGLAVKRPYLSHTGRASNTEKQPTGRGPEGCVENGPAAALLVGYVSIKICAHCQSGSDRLADGPF